MHLYAVDHNNLYDTIERERNDPNNYCFVLLYKFLIGRETLSFTRQCDTFCEVSVVVRFC